MTMPAVRLSTRFRASASSRARRRQGRSQFEGGLPGSWTERPPMPMPSAFYPSTGGGRSWTGGIPPLSPADALAQEGVAQGDEVRPLLVVLAVAVAAGRRLVEIGLAIAHRLQLGGHLARVAGMHAVVAPRGGEQDRRIGLAGLSLVVGRVGREPRPFLRLVRVAVLGD